MFQNISFTFLCALAFISWSLLCYLDAIDDRQIHNDYKVELYTERPTYSEAPKYCAIKITENSMIHRIFDMVITYTLILVTTIAISKALQWLELQMPASMQQSLANIGIRIFPFVKYAPIELVEDDNNDMIIMEKDETVDLVSIPPMEDAYTIRQKRSTEESWEVEEKWGMGDKWQMEDKWTTGGSWEMHENDIELRHKWSDDRNMMNENVNRAQYTQYTQSNMPQDHQENMELKEQLNDLQERCRELLQELRAANQNKSSCIDLRPNRSNSSFDGSDDSSGVILWKKPVLNSSSGLSIESTAESVSHNVYVTHSHYHINFNGPVQLTKQDINVSVSSTKKLSRRSEFLQVWGTFIKGPEKHPMLTGINNILI